MKRIAPVTALALVAIGGALAALAPACGGETPNVKHPENPEAGVQSIQNDKGAEVGITEGPTEHADISADAKSDYQKGWSSWVAGDLPGAKTAFERASKADTKNPAPHYSLGCVLERLGDNSGAQTEYRAAFNAKSDYEPALCAYSSNLARTGHTGEADQFMTEKVAKAPTSPKLKVCAAEVKSLAKDSISAQQLAQDALRIDPGFKEAMVMIARDHHRAGRADLSRYALTAILDGFGDAAPPRDKDNAEAHLLRGLIRRESGQRIGAMEDFKAAQAKRPDLVEAQIQIGAMKLEAGNALEAQPLLENAIKFAPKSALAHLNLGDCYRLLGRVADAKKELDVALSLDSSLPQIHYAMGLLYLFAPTYPGMSESDKLGAAIKELGTYKQMRGPKAPPGVQDDVDELVTRAQQKQTELNLAKAVPSATASAKPSGSAKPAASASAKPK
jgi:Tfp pilus assembly protein PilF